MDSFCDFFYFFLNRNFISSFIRVVCAFLDLSCAVGEVFWNFILA